REKEFAGQLGLSRNSLREAIRALSLIRVLDVRHGDGTYVASLRPETLLESLSFAAEVAQDEAIAEQFEVRRLLEPAATALAATRISDEQLAELVSCIDRMERADTPEDLVRDDIDFHDTIVAAAGNQTLASLCRGLSSRTARVRVWRVAVEEGAVEWTHSQHRAIYRALVERDSTLALAAATVHVADVERWLRRWRGATP
ncbi:MAG: FCD domain-containing protein, partial [Gemmatimonas sp.]|nr:FCD domain-containing protein [Gemmatimonas sp.]